MALKKGERAPDFVLDSTSEGKFRLSENLGEGLVLYFYPKDFTSGCTAEACSFRDEIEYFTELGIRVIGISTDTVESHLRFQKKHRLPFDLLSDTEGVVSKTYNAWVPFLNISKRVTYLIDPNGQIVESYSNALMARNHIREMKKAGKSITLES